jgi:acyl carrier protein
MNTEHRRDQLDELLSASHARVVDAILVENLGITQAQIVPEARLDQDFAVDSLTLVEITMALEARLHLAIPDEQWDGVATVADLYEIIAAQLREAGRH